jgi:predicted nucleotide-binding protein
MTKTKETLRSLIEEGEKFTYENFCSARSQYGNPSSYSQKWIVWRTRVEAFVKSKFGEDSVPFVNLSKGLSIRLLGNGSDSFVNAKTLILGALVGAELALEDEAIKEIGSVEVSSAGISISNKVFIVHGHDEKAKNELEIFLKELGLQPIVLHRQADEGQTIIEKFEKHADVGYAFILLTPDEVSYSANQESLEDNEKRKEYRARPNVIFEFGYFVGKLGRQRVCCLYTGNVTLPSDISGLLYKKFNCAIEESGYSIIKELKAAGYRVDL